MADFSFEAQPREVTGKKVKALRREGLVPFTVYGPKIEPMTLQVTYRTMELALMKAGGTNLIDITVEGGQTYTVLARDVQRDVIKGFIKHVDFFAVDRDATIRTEVPVNFIGHAPAVEQGAILMTGSNFLTIEVLPGDLIHEIEVDLSSLKELNDSIHVRDLSLGDKVIIINDPDELLASVQISSAARSLEDEAMFEEEESMASGAEPEVISRGKDEEEE